MGKKILMIGGGGHCKVVLDSLISQNLYSEIAIIDKDLPLDSTILGIPVIGRDQDLIKLYNEGYKYAFISLGSIGNWNIRERISKMLTDIGFELPSIIDSSARISSNVTVSQGAYIGKNVIINPSVFLGSNVIINTGVIVEHDCKIGDFVHLAPGSVICGDVKIGRGTHIGAGSVIRNQLSVGENTLIGLGSCVVSPIGNDFVAYGNPCKEHKKR